MSVMWRGALQHLPVPLIAATIFEKDIEVTMTTTVKEIIEAKQKAGEGSFLWLKHSGECSLWPDQEANTLSDDRDDLGHWELDAMQYNELLETGLVDCTDSVLAREDTGLPKKERRRIMKPIDVCFGLSGRNEPLVTFAQSPLAFCDLELGPQQLRDIAAVLVKIADDSEALGLNPGEKRRSYKVGE